MSEKQDADDDDSSGDDGGNDPASDAATEGVRVQVRSRFLPEHSAPRDYRYAFAYTITIANEGTATATLLSRHWVITDGNGNVEHVRGPGVIGQTPILEPGKSFRYTSGAVLRTPHGVMQGEYLMERPDGARFEAEIAPFALATPESIN